MTARGSAENADARRVESVASGLRPEKAYRGLDLVHLAGNGAVDAGLKSRLAMAKPRSTSAVSGIGSLDPRSQAPPCTQTSNGEPLVPAS